MRLRLSPDGRYVAYDAPEPGAPVRDIFLVSGCQILRPVSFGARGGFWNRETLALV
jgi:hypothetical protein